MNVKDEFPGTMIPSREREPELYDYYWRALALWAFKWGPYLMDVERRFNENRSA